MMASPLPAQSSRASSPSSTISNLDVTQTRHGKTIDDLTVALANFSRAQTPDNSIGCCCGRDDCESMRAWADVRAKLESRLVLSAEVGQALLQRYEAYVRRQDAALSREASSIFTEAPEDARQQLEVLTRKLDTVTEENSLMESRIQELLIKSEMSEATMRTMQRELHDARATANKLAAQQSRSAGLELRLAQQLQERDDMRQERDAALVKEKHANLKAALHEEKSSRLQREVDALKEELNSLRASRAQFSHSVLEEAKDRIETLRHSIAPSLAENDTETARVLETLVADNEALKRDVAELNTLLSDSRDELEEVRDELAEMKRRGCDTFPEELDETKVDSHPTVEIVRSYRSGSFDLNLGTELASSPKSHYLRGRLPTRIRGVQTDPVTILPNPSRSPTRNHLQPNFTLPSPRSSSLGVESVSSREPRSETSSINHSHSELHHSSSSSRDTPTTSSFPPNVQGNTGPSPIMPGDPRPLTTITTRITALLTRMSQADARTLTLRLRRQHLLGNPKQISETTVKAIVSEASSLRLGRDGSDNPTASVVNGRLIPQQSHWIVTRSEFKSLLRLFKDVFMELGALRGQLNEVIFDPSLASKLRKEALEPETQPPVNTRTLGRAGKEHSAAVNSWMLPIQKLFGQSQEPAAESSSGKQSRVASVAKQAPAVAASTTTVNVEFASGGVRGTGTIQENASAGQEILRGAGPRPQPQIHAPIPSRSLVGIFAGAQQPEEKWVVLPRGSKEKDRVKQLRGPASNGRLAFRPLGGMSNADKAATIGRSVTANFNSRRNRISRDLDAVLGMENDVEDGPVLDFRDTLQRTLRRRGLSDSSIHTTFLVNKADAEGKDEGDDVAPITSTPTKLAPSAPIPISPTKPKSFSSSPVMISPRQSSKGSVPPPSLPSSPPRVVPPPRSPSTRIGIGISRTLTAWAHLGDSGVVYGSPREETHAAWARRGLEGRDF